MSSDKADIVAQEMTGRRRDSNATAVNELSDIESDKLVTYPLDRYLRNVALSYLSSVNIRLAIWLNACSMDELLGNTKPTIAV